MPPSPRSSSDVIVDDDDALLSVRPRFKVKFRRANRDRLLKLPVVDCATEKDVTAEGFCDGGAIFWSPKDPEAASAASTAACTASKSTEIIPDDVDHVRGRRLLLLALAAAAAAAA